VAERICIVSSTCLSSGPRVVKEADALAAAGYPVHVVVCQTLPWMQRWDAELAAGRGWSYSAVPWFARRRRPLGLGQRLVQRGAAALGAVVGPAPGLAELGSGEVLLALMAEASHHRAGLYIAHNLVALPVASALARVRGALLGFDAEDDHLGELPSAQWASARGRRIDAVLRNHLPRCAHLTAASQGMAEALARRYGVREPTVVHNVFPWADRAGLDGQRRERGDSALSIYWYSQTLGLDRGVQDVLRACGLLRGDFELHLRGNVSEEVRRSLLSVAQEAGVGDRVRLHAKVPPGELLSRTAEHDVGLALEQPVSENRLQTVTNKLFFYMLAGLAVAATDTPGQRRIMDSAPDVGFTYAPGDADALARGLQRYLDEPATLARARAASLAAAERRYCWEREQQSLVDAVEGALARR
jgi:glycosyltransferase involved in cell wall biosynthesis